MADNDSEDFPSILNRDGSHEWRCRCRKCLIRMDKFWKNEQTPEESLAREKELVKNFIDRIDRADKRKKNYRGDD